jgi:hypothetical protein
MAHYPKDIFIPPALGLFNLSNLIRDETGEERVRVLLLAKSRRDEAEEESEGFFDTGGARGGIR